MAALAVCALCGGRVHTQHTQTVQPIQFTFNSHSTPIQLTLNSALFIGVPKVFVRLE